MESKPQIILNIGYTYANQLQFQVSNLVPKSVKH